MRSGLPRRLVRELVVVVRRGVDGETPPISEMGAIISLRTHSQRVYITQIDDE